MVVSFETFSERDSEFLRQSSEEYGTSFEHRNQPLGDERILLVEHRDLSLDDIDSMPDLQAIFLFERGRATLPVDRLTARGVEIRPVPNLGATGVAEHVFALSLAIKKQIVQGHQAVIENHWRAEISEPLYTDQRAHVFNWSGIENIGWLYQETIGIVGFGRIGKAIAKRALAFDMRVLYYNRHRLAVTKEQELGVRFATLDELLTDSDIVTLNLPFNESSERLLGADQFRMMKPSAILINAARGRVVDEKALITALQEGQIAGAGIDVLEYEPPFPENPILQLKNVVLSPHLAGIYDPVAREQQFRTSLRWATELKQS